MARATETVEDGFIKRNSAASEKANEHVVTPDPDASNAQALTGHTGEPDVVQDGDGNVRAVHQTRVITDPNDPEAVQVPDPEVYPEANGTRTNPANAALELTPEEAFAEAGDEDTYEEPEAEAPGSDSQGTSSSD